MTYKVILYKSPDDWRGTWIVLVPWTCTTTADCFRRTNLLNFDWKNIVIPSIEIALSDELKEKHIYVSEKYRIY